MKLKEIMNTLPAVLPPEASVVEAAQKMDELGAKAVAVCEDGKVLGILTDRDIAVNVIAKGLDPLQLQLRDVMSSPVVYASSEESLEEAVAKMDLGRVSQIIVLDEARKLAGLASLSEARACLTNAKRAA